MIESRNDRYDLMVDKIDRLVGSIRFVVWKKPLLIGEQCTIFMACRTTIGVRDGTCLNRKEVRVCFVAWFEFNRTFKGYSGHI